MGLTRNLAIGLAWMLVVVVSLVLISVRLSFSYDLGVLLPRASSPAEKVLVERVGQSPGANVLFLGIRSSNQKQLAELTRSLRKSPLYSRVVNPHESFDIEDVPAVIDRYRYLLDGRDLSVSFLTDQLKDRAKELRLIGGRQFAELVARDPSLAAAHTLTQSSGYLYRPPDDPTVQSESIIIIETVAPGFDIAGQREAIAHLQSQIQQTFGPSPPDSRISGVGMIGTILEQQIRQEAQTRSIAASILLILILSIAYRRPTPVLLAGIPVVTGGIVALAVLSVLSESVHGITLAFGFTLLGVGIDYPVHYFSHSRRIEASTAIRNIWPTLRLGVISTLIAYMALSLSGSEGTRQLGIFTVAGLTTIALVTRYVLPAIDSFRAGTTTHTTTYAIDAIGSGSGPPSNRDAAPLRWIPLPFVCIFATLAVALNWDGQIFDDDLSRLSPVSDELISIDQELRQAAGTPDTRMLIAIRHDTVEQVLQATEQIELKLRELPTDVLEGTVAVSRLLPSKETQRRRLEKLPESAVLATRIREATSVAGMNPTMFEAFIKSVQSSKSLRLLDPDAYRGSLLEPLVDSQLYNSEGQWVSIISLHSDASRQNLVQALNGALKSLPDTENATVVDLKHSSETLVKRYRRGIAYVLFIAIAIIVCLLIRQTTLRRGCWAMAATLTSVVASASLVYSVGGRLDLYHMIALLLVAGLVLDYALFLSREQASGRDSVDTRHAVLTCASSTALTFALLAMSTIPALHSLGSIVAVGALVGLGICWWCTQMK